MKRKKPFVIGITGKTGSGKTFVAELLGEMTGFEVIHCDKYLNNIILIEPIRKLLELRHGMDLDIGPGDEAGRKNIDGKIPYMVANMSRAEARLFTLVIDIMLCDELIKRRGEPVIVDGLYIPKFYFSKEFASLAYITSAGGTAARHEKIARRHPGLPFEVIKKADDLCNGVFGYKNIKYDRTFSNDYTNVPAGLEQYAEKILRAAR
ncbi:MAG: hypothetical protein FWD15_04715 [Alphaproteobacteria bacterium]|nr:hypothetical protein [Alphaproteobacteria bacterium]